MSSSEPNSNETLVNLILESIKDKPGVKLVLYNKLRFSFVKEDVEEKLVERNIDFNKIPIVEDREVNIISQLADNITSRLVYGGMYASNISYFQNIENQIDIELNKYKS